jgi:serine/threonine protein phosphatase PrpC
MTTLRAAALTDVGRVRTTNQDWVLATESLFAVADGMGGHAGGEVASRTAVESLKEAFEGDPTADGLAEAVKRANLAVWERSRDDAELRGMGTTLTAAALVSNEDGDRLALVNVGDSRAYLFHGGQLDQLTDDHSLVEEMVRSGELTADEAAIHPHRHILTRALGVDPDVDVDSSEVTPRVGDRVLLCSDGLVNEVAESEINAVLTRTGDPDDAARQLVQLARAHGGSDNITVVVVDVVEGDHPAAAAPSAVPVAEPSAPPDSPPEPAPRAAPADEATETRRFTPRLTFRVALFVLLLVAVLVGAAVVVGWFANRSYFVGLDGDQITIYHGRPGGFLWFKPRLAEHTGLTTAQVLPARVDDLRRGTQEPSLGAARAYVSNLVQEARSLPDSPMASPSTTAPPSGVATPSSAGP